jgi:hypothetical protein
MPQQRHKVACHDNLGRPKLAPHPNIRSLILNISLEVIMVNRRRGDEQAGPDELGNDPGQVGPDSAGQSGDGQNLSSIADSADESVLELADSDQALEAGIVEGIEDAADHPERPVHTHVEYGRPDDLPPVDGSDELDGQGDVALAADNEINVEDLSDETDRPDKSAA